MNKHISQNILNELYKEKVKEFGKRGIEEINTKWREKKTNSNKSIFLCHSHLDKTIVNKILLLFYNLQVDLYIDWMDTNMPTLTDRNTANEIKNKIDSSHKFLFLATYNALRSKWCNWELGLAYSSKGEKDFAILPIETTSGKWRGSEYLHLYPEMEINYPGKIEGVKKEHVKVRYSDDRLVDFDNWINN